MTEGHAPSGSAPAELEVEDVYVLSPMQQGMLFHELLAPSLGVYVQQTSCVLEGAFDLSALRRAWQEAVDFHPVLRTVFVADNPKRPLQVVRRHASLAFAQEDWRAVPEEEREARLEAWLEADRVRGFDLARPPLLRLALHRLGADSWRLVWTFHHLLLDGWAADLLLHEVLARYSAARAGRPADIVRPRPYRDFIAWLRRRDTAADEAFWRARLEGFTTPTPLVVERLTGAPAQAESHIGAEPELELDDATSRSVDSFARRHGLTLGTLVHAAWALLLSRYSGEGEVVFGSTVSGRPADLPGVDAMLGLFINTIPVRVKVPRGSRVVDWLREVQSELLESRRHEWTPLGELHAFCQVPRGTPLFESILVLENYPERATPRARAQLPIVSARSHERTKVPLMLVVTPGQRLVLRIERDPERFDAATIGRMLGHLRMLLAGMVTRPDAKPSALPLLDAGERAPLLPSARRVAPDGGGAWLLHERFEAQAARTPDATAVTLGAESLTYRELDRRAAALACRLRDCGVGPEVRVAISAERSLELVAGILGTVKAGGAYVPLDPAYPEERLAFLLADSQAAVVLAPREIAARLPDHRARVVLLDDTPPDDARSDGARRDEARGDRGPPRSPDAALYVIYTSGSTGKPKGVMVTHRNVARLFEATRESFAFDERDVWTLFHSASFDFSVWELWGALLHGGRLVVVPRQVSRTPEAFLELLAAERVTVLNQTPSAFRQLVNVEDAVLPRPALSLRWVIFGGEALDPRALRPWLARHGDARPRLVNMYGITETTVHVTHRHLRAADAEGAARSVIGGPLDDLRLYVVDARLEPVPIGVPGELVVGGPGLARGYLGRPELTAERFVPDPWSREPGARLYRSGDLARRLPDGDIEYLGRIDEQVKVRGFRVELGEVEAALREHPAVRDALAAATEAGSLGRRIAAYVVLRDGLATTGEELRRFLEEKLPEHALPAFLVPIEALPLTPHGKLDRRALPAPDGSRAPLDASFAAARTPREAALAAVWSEALERATPGIDDNYFALGGDSIRSIRVRALARERGLDFTLQQLFENPTIRRLAAVLETPGAAGAAPRERVLPFGLSEADRARLPADVVDAFPLSMLQAGMVYHSEATSDYVVYLTSAHLRAPLDREALEQAARRVVARHPMLRTSFDLTSFGEPLQLVHREVDVALAFEDLTALEPGAQQAWIDRWIEAETRRRFDWTRAPLFRMHVHRRGADTFQFTLAEPVFDGWSVASLLTELFRTYLALLAGRPLAEEPPPAASYRQFVALECETLRSEEARRYWARRLGERAPCRVPLGPAPEAAPDAPAVEQCPLALPGEVAEGLQRLARATGVPLKSVLLAAHLKALSALTGQSAVTTGFLVNGRPEELGGEELLGTFLNTAPFALELTSGTWSEFVRRTFEAERELLPFRRFPIQELERLHGAESLFNTVFNFTHFHVYRRLEEVGGLEVLGGGGSEQTYFALTAQFALDHATAELAAWLDYRTLEVARERVEAIAGAYERVLAAMASDPLARHESFSLLGAEERRRIVVEWNESARELPGGATLASLVAAQVERTPEAVALEFRGETLSYGALGCRANRLAQRLSALGVRPGALVGIHAAQSMERVVGILATLEAGGAYVPLDPSYPRERLALLLEDARPRVVLCQAALAGALPPSAAVVVPLDEVEEDARGSAEEERPWGGASPRDLAYVIYTSGSTGRPKGVMVEHAGAVNVVLASLEAFRLGPGSRLAQLASTSFDLSVLEIFGALASGARLVLVERETLGAPERLTALLGEARITAMTCVPSLLDALPPADLPDLATIVVGGEACGAETAARWSRGRRLLNAYAPTETTVYTTLHEHPSGLREAPAIGRRIQNSRVYLLDPHGEPVPVGVPGEIHVGGVGVARGYLGRPELTAERFVPDPFSAAPGARLYRTGDLARWRPDGALEFLGRADRQVKIRGHRLELGEIEAALAAHADVREALALVREDPPLGKRLVAYVAARAGAAVRGADLRRFLAERLPEPAVPSVLVVLDALPRDVNGKLDRRALPAPGSEREPAGGADVPRTPLEEIVAGIWAELFGLARVGLHEGFFELGGHSLLATRLVSRVREAFRVELTLRSLFEDPTVAGLARRVAEARQAVAPPPPLVRAERGPTAPLSFAQQRLWFLDQLEPGSALYNVPAAVRLRGPLVRAALERSFGALVARHEALRTTFATAGGLPGQVVAPAGAFQLAFLERQGISEPEQHRLALAEAERPFDLARGPLLRATLLCVADDEHLLLVTLHHIVSDGWSMGVLVRELGALYDAFVSGRAPVLPELPVQYADFAAWQRAWLAGEALAREVAWWKETLRGAPVLLELPADRPRPPVPSHRGACVLFDLPRPLVDALAALARRERATLFMTLLSAFDVVLQRFSGQDDVLVGSPVAGRDRAESEGLIGFFVNTLVLRTDLSGDPAFRALVGRVRETCLGAFAHADVPFEKIVEELEPARDLGRSPFFQVMFDLQNLPVHRAELRGLSLAPLEVEGRGAKFDLTLTLHETEGGLAGAAEYATDLFDEATIARLLNALRRVLEAVAVEPELRLSRLPVVGEAERKSLLHEWNASAAPMPGESSLHALVEAAADSVPGAVAAEWAGGALTYGELERRANRLARRLVRLGVGPGERVAVVAERTGEMVVGLLAALKAGAAYVPVDPAYPAERIALLFSDASPRALLAPRSCLADLPAHGAAVVALDDVLDDALDAALEDESAARPACRARADDLAYVIYTSGSTGRPKGVMVTHRNAVHSTAARLSHYTDRPRRFVLLSSFAFDSSVAGIFWTLAAGGTLLLPPPGLEKDPRELARFLAAERASHVLLLPTLYAQVLDALTRAPAELRAVVVAGEACARDVVERHHERLPHAALFNEYGPTEGTVWSSVERCQPRSPRPLVAIGRPVPRVRLHVVDALGELAPLGAPGELLVAGEGVARGYLGRPDLTAERFVPDPFSAVPGGRAYRTGDLARRLPDGRLEFLGRNDEQVKVRGHRVEPGEIEAALRAHPGVREAAVVARADGSGSLRLAAYVVAASAPPPASGELRAYLRALLPEPWVPSFFTALEELPRGANGKLDRRALPSPAGAPDGGELVAPRTPLEEVVADVWAEVLELERVGVRQGFFELGGHSLLATQVVSRLREALRVEIPLRALFERPTVADFAESLLARADGARIARTAELLVELAAMSDEEAQALLARDAVRGGTT